MIVCCKRRLGGSREDLGMSWLPIALSFTNDLHVLFSQSRHQLLVIAVLQLLDDCRVFVSVR